MAGLEACQADTALADTLETLTASLAKAQGKLFMASNQPPESAASIDMMNRAMDYLAQGLKVLQNLNVESEAVGTSARSIAQALKTLHPIVQAAKDDQQNSAPPPDPTADPNSPDTLNVNVNTMLNMNTDHQFYNGFSENIEEGGIFIATFDPKPVGAKVLVNFKLPGGRPVAARGNVHFVREFNPLASEMAPGMGVKFTEILPEDKKAIEEYLRKRAPLFYDD